VIDTSAPWASWFLWIVPTVFLLLFALPLTFAPIAWARLFRWREGRDDDLTLYFGPLLGCGRARVGGGRLSRRFRAARARRGAGDLRRGRRPARLVHVWGALTRRQPWTENLEIVLYLGVGAAAAWLRATLV